MFKKSSLENGLITPPSIGNHRFGGYSTSMAPNSFKTLQGSRHPENGACLSRIPHSSLMAFVMCFIGVILFSIMMVWSFNASVEQLRRALNISDIPWLDKIHILFFIIATLMIIVALILLTIGVLSTGSTRHEVYRRESARQGGRIACLASIIISYLLHLFWMMAFALTAILAFIYMLFSTLCHSINGEFASENDCLDLSVFRSLVKNITNSNLILCGGQAQQFCAVSTTAVVWYLAGLFASGIVCLGLVQFMATSATNYAHLRHEKKRTELEEVLYAETGTNFANMNAQLPLCQFRGGSSGNLMDYQVDSMNPSGTILSRKLPPPPQQPVRMRPATQQTQQMRYYQPPQQNAQQYSTNLRRTSYHASQNVDVNNGWGNTLY